MINNPSRGAATPTAPKTVPYEEGGTLVRAGAQGGCA